MYQRNEESLINDGDSFHNTKYDMIKEKGIKKNDCLVQKNSLMESIDLEDSQLGLKVFLDKKNIFLKKIKKELLILSKNKVTPFERKIYMSQLIRRISINLNEDDELRKITILLDKKNSDFFQRIKNVSPSITEQQLRHCLFIKYNIVACEVAKLFSISPHSVIIARYRIKKKLKLSKNDNLYSFIQKL